MTTGPDFLIIEICILLSLVLYLQNFAAKSVTRYNNQDVYTVTFIWRYENEDRRGKREENQWKSNKIQFL